MDKIDLVNYRGLAQEVRQLKTQLKTLESALYSPKGQQFTSTPRATSGPKKTMEDAVVGHMRLDALYREKLAEQEATLYNLEKAVSTLEDPAQRMVIRERYFTGLSWRRIIANFAALGYSERQVYRLHGYALLKLKEVEL